MNALKGTASAPNKSIRRRLESHFTVADQNEHFSSQGCPYCKERSLEKVTLNRREWSKPLSEILDVEYKIKNNLKQERNYLKGKTKTTTRTNYIEHLENQIHTVPR